MSKDEKLDAFVKCHRRADGVMWDLCNKIMGAVMTNGIVGVVLSGAIPPKVERGGILDEPRLPGIPWHL